MEPKKMLDLIIDRRIDISTLMSFILQGYDFDEIYDARYQFCIGVEPNDLKELISYVKKIG